MMLSRRDYSSMSFPYFFSDLSLDSYISNVSVLKRGFIMYDGTELQNVSSFVICSRCYSSRCRVLPK